MSAIKFDWLVARQGSQFGKHNTAVIYVTDTSWPEGIAFDHWRKGRLPYCTKVTGDKYPSHLHPLSVQRKILRCE